MARCLALFAGLHAAAALSSKNVEKLSDGSEEQFCGERPIPFTAFIEKFNRPYEQGSKEYAERSAIYAERADASFRHNCDVSKPWKAAINHLSDWTEKELQGLLGHKRVRRHQTGLVALSTRTSVEVEGHRYHNSGVFQQDLSVQQQRTAPAAFSWSNLSSIQETWDQGNCGSCWAVASTSVMRAHAEIKGLPRTFSASQVVACTPNPNACGGTGGCEGATAELAYEYVLRAGLVAGDDAFRDSGGAQSHCPAEQQVATEKTTEGVFDAAGNEVHRLAKFDKGMRGRSLGMVGWTKLAENKENPIVRALLEQGPLYVAVAAGSGWFSYAGGVLTPQGCDTKNVVNHAVVMYGYGVKLHTRIGDVRYWQIKNSWGSNWGEAGSIRLQRLDEEEKYCGWDKSPQEGSGCKDGPPQVWVCGSCGILYDAVIPTFEN